VSNIQGINTLNITDSLAELWPSKDMATATKPNRLFGQIFGFAEVRYISDEKKIKSRIKAASQKLKEIAGVLCDLKMSIRVEE
jgi:hypothetical protein